MASWLIVTILSYFLFALSSIGDKLFLKGKPTPASYVFYVSVFGLLVIVLIPFANFSIPGLVLLGWIILTALTRFMAVYFAYVAIEKFEVSRVVPSIGAIQPILMFFLAWAFFGEYIISSKNILAFLLLLLGGVLISLEKKIKFNLKYIGLTFLVALLISLDFTFAKIIYSSTSFLNGFIWIFIFIFFFAMSLLLFKGPRKEIFSKSVVSNKSEQILFLGTQSCGGLASILYNLAISLAPAAFFAIISSLKGVQYAFLFLIALVLSIFWPKIFKENLSKNIVIKKLFAIIIIIAGLIILAI
ncbi:MAG: hypothetical protein WC711_00480 [Candidatus Staskawiczbacteria bacterium]|jgi:drug/metabolite transporter (DMT)-like permease